jgi:hypothetical protein
MKKTTLFEFVSGIYIYFYINILFYFINCLYFLNFNL